MSVDEVRVREDVDRYLEYIIGYLSEKGVTIDFLSWYADTRAESLITLFEAYIVEGKREGEFWEYVGAQQAAEGEYLAEMNGQDR